MKKLLKLIALVTLSAILCLTFSSCGFVRKVAFKTESNNIPITYNKKYIREGGSETDVETYTFYANQTGVMERYYFYDKNSPEFNYVLSGTVEFEWRIATDGGVYLFETKTQFNSDHTDGKTIGLTRSPCYFSEDFMVYTSSGEFGTSYRRCILEGSSLEKALKDK